MVRAAAVLALCLGSASAFVARSPATTSTASRGAAVLKFSAADQLGAIPPTNFFDPLKLCKDEETFERFRAAELKHGRVAQLAVLGYVIPEVYRWPGEIAPGIKFADIPHGVAAINAIPALGWMQMVFLIGAVDYWGIFGDYPIGKNFLGINQPGDEEKRLEQELSHGRLAMVAFLELLRHDSQNFVAGEAFDGLDAFITGLPFLYK